MLYIDENDSNIDSDNDLDEELDSDLDEELDNDLDEELDSDLDEDISENDLVTRQRKKLASLNKEHRLLKKDYKRLSALVQSTSNPSVVETKEENTTKTKNPVKESILEQQIQALQEKVAQIDMQKESTEVMTAYCQKNSISKSELDRLLGSNNFKRIFDESMRESKNQQSRLILLNERTKPLIDKLRKNTIGTNVAPIVGKVVTQIPKKPSVVDAALSGVYKTEQDYIKRTQNKGK